MADAKRRGVEHQKAGAVPTDASPRAGVAFRELKKFAAVVERKGFWGLKDFPIRPKVAALSEQIYTAISAHSTPGTRKTVYLPPVVKAAITHMCVALDYACEIAAASGLPSLAFN